MFNLNIFIANIKQGVGPQVFSNISNGPSPWVPTTYVLVEKYLEN